MRDRRFGKIDTGKVHRPELDLKIVKQENFGGEVRKLQKNNGVGVRLNDLLLSLTPLTYLVFFFFYTHRKKKTHAENVKILYR